MSLPNGNGHRLPEPRPVPRLIIELLIDADGAERVQVTGTPEVMVSKVMAYGLLERAKDAIRQIDPKNPGLLTPQKSPLAL